jgi:enediyne biosynthesis protein E4
MCACRRVTTSSTLAAVLSLAACDDSAPSPASAVPESIDVSAMFSEVALASPPGGALAPCLIFEDLDGDARPDLFLVVTASRGDLAERALVYRNDVSGFTRVDVSLGPLRNPQSCAAADYDRDGRLDVFIGGAGGGRLLRNRGAMAFDDVTVEAGAPVAEPFDTRVPVFLDYDRDGWQDLYLTRIELGDRPFRCTESANGMDYTCRRANGATGGAPSLLLRNANGHFVTIDDVAGAPNGPAAHAVATLDWNLDGWTDLFVANDFGGNRVYINRGGSFTDLAPDLGLDVYNHGMGVACAQFTDGPRWDVFIADYGPSQLWVGAEVTPSLMRDRAWESRIGTATRTDSSWAPLAADFDHDGRMDLFVASAASTTTLDELQPGANGLLHTAAPQRDLFFFQRGAGPVFSVGRWPHAAGVGPGVDLAVTAAADVEADGDLDLAELYGPYPDTVFRLIRNDVPMKGHWLQVGLADNADGATITLDAGGHRQRRALTRNTGSLGGSWAVAHFGLGPATRVDRIVVTAPTGATWTFNGPIAVDRRMNLAPPR